ncbi:hypothetical protein JRO89_XS09G0090100 [Xanthoceras sorbifolium]|uniref:Protein kinase domain-containing protein n=1 Tax=Xanthoceras sorbifolium TaxID=99658 RepID=A0ABQ8HKT9_9ROSI|nr:hypothetical protein JRO89_XS09G0090100 [Xanthoceras sorbifolium]
MLFIKTSIFLLLLQQLVLCSRLHLHHHHPHSLLADKAALLAFRNTITSDPNATLANWKEAVDVCNFTGVRCNKQHHRVVELNLTNCQLLGHLSPVLSNLTGLRFLVLSNNQLYGTIPAEFSNLQYLHFLQLDGNNLQGGIPESFALFSKLTLLFLFGNILTGTLPPSFFSNCTSLANIDISNNFFTGKIPREIGDSRGLWNLNLYNNQFTGEVPESLINTSMYSLDLEYNHISGELPSDIVGKLPSLQNLHLSYNNMVSHDLNPFFTSLGNCTYLDEVELAGMGLGGTLPTSIGRLINLSQLLLQENHITGSIPPHIANISGLMTLNLTCNLLNGMTPSGGIFDSITNMSFLGNHLLCGVDAGIPICSQKRHWFRSRMLLIIFILVICISVFLSTICCVIGIRRIKVMISSAKSEAIRKPRTPGLMHNFPRISYRELSEATRGFDEQRLVGTGSYGRVYKGVLSDGTAIAVKVLQLQSGNSTKSFNRECQVLKRIRHRNLIRIITACSLADFKAIVLPYMSNGSLDSCLYPNSGSLDLSLLQRVNICSDIAEGMAYLHHHSPVKVIHCDLKPSNVLLNDDMTALVSDFGIARLVTTVGVVDNLGNSTANLLCGSIGYIAPEYGFGSNTSTKGDVYSFGVVVLEMVTRRRPTDDTFAGGLSLQRWVRNHYHGRMEKVIDSSLMRAAREQSAEVKRMWDVAIGELMELGILCTQESPSTRPTMLDCADDLDRLKRYLSGDTTATFASSLGISSSTLDND